VVALHPRVGAQRLEQRDQRAARAVLVLSHGDAAGERVRFFSRSFPAIAISRAPTRSNAGGQRDTRAIARLDAGVRCARVQSRIEIDRRRRVEGAPPSVEEAVVLVGDTFWKPSRKRLKALPNQLLQTKFWELSHCHINEGESYDTRFSSLREHFAARGGGKPGADRG
jgi:hypothetical protein